MDKEAVGMGREREAFEREFNAYDWRHKGTGEICAHFWQAGRAELRAALAQQPASQAAGLTTSDEATVRAILEDPMWSHHAEIQKALLQRLLDAALLSRNPVSGTVRSAWDDCRHAITGAIAFGQQGANPPPEGHWLTEFWQIGALLSRAAPSGEPVAWLRDDGGDAITAQKKRDLAAHNGLPGAKVAATYSTALTYAAPQPSAQPDFDPRDETGLTEADWREMDRQAEQPAEEARGVEYTKAIGDAGEAYMAQFKFAHPLPAQFRWSDLWDAMQRAALLAAPAAGTGEDKAVYCECFQSKPKDGYCQDCGLTRMEWLQAATGAQGLTSADVEHIYKLIEVTRMPNAESVADDHNAAVRHLRALAASKEA